MWGYIAIDRWLCDSVAVADLPETSGVPDFECGQIDVDATRLHESKEEYRIKRRLEDLFDDRSYIGILTQKPGSISRRQRVTNGVKTNVRLKNCFRRLRI